MPGAKTYLRPLEEGEPNKVGGDRVRVPVQWRCRRTVVRTIVIAIEGAIEIREELDAWMDSWLHSRNLDRVCEWLSGRSVGTDLYALRVIEVFIMVSSAWGRLSSTGQGYHSPCTSWITSTEPASKANDTADELSYTLREQRRQSRIARNIREGRDQSDLDQRLGLWIEKCPICLVQKRVGIDVDVYHDLGACKDEKREVVAVEIAKIQAIKFAKGVCCQVCAVPQETCHDTMYSSELGKQTCLYGGIVREAVAAIIVVGPDTIVRKMYAWMRSEGIWSGDVALRGDEIRYVNQTMLEWFSGRASWRYLSASILVQVFNQLDRWVETFGKGGELEDWLG
jgi:hypothetical protein